MKKGLKIFGIITLVVFAIGVIALALETPEQRAEREAKAIQIEQQNAQKQALESQDEAQKKAEQDEEKHLQSIKIDLMTVCQLAIKKELRNEKSMDVDFHSILIWRADNNNYRVGFKFNADNAFGGSLTHTAVCDFDENQQLLKKEVVQK